MVKSISVSELKQRFPDRQPVAGLEFERAEHEAIAGMAEILKWSRNERAGADLAEVAVAYWLRRVKRKQAAGPLYFEADTPLHAASDIVVWQRGVRLDVGVRSTAFDGVPEVINYPADRIALRAYALPAYIVAVTVSQHADGAAAAYIWGAITHLELCRVTEGATEWPGHPPYYEVAAEEFKDDTLIKLAENLDSQRSNRPDGITLQGRILEALSHSSTGMEPKHIAGGGDSESKVQRALDDPEIGLKAQRLVDGPDDAGRYRLIAPVY